MRLGTAVLVSAIICACGVSQVNSQGDYNDDACPLKLDKWQRVGKTKYYVLEKQTNKNFVNWKQAVKECAKSNMKLARIDNLPTFSVVGRALELIIKRKTLRDTWCSCKIQITKSILINGDAEHPMLNLVEYFLDWVDAIFDENTETYLWQDSKSAIGHGNFFYRQPRPVGVGAWLTFEDVYNSRVNLSHCLAFAMPWPLDQKELAFGFSTTFDEKPCISKKKRYALCEHKDANCKLKNTDPFILLEDKGSYFDDGNWIFGDRRYIVNWKSRNINESGEYCQSIGLKVYTPNTHKDFCLVPLLKMWSRNVTASHFWTNWRYDMSLGQYKDLDGKSVANTSNAWMNFTEWRTSKHANLFCVSNHLLYELKSQMPSCKHGNIGFTTCGWNMMSFVPANCNNKIATICQHQNYTTRECPFGKGWLRNLTIPLHQNATTPYGYQGNVDVHRSKYKQTFGSLVCPEKYKMLRNTNLLSKQQGPKIHFEYDYQETYWIVEKTDGFNKDINSTCTVYNGSKKTEEKVPCSNWHFYLCEKLPKRQSTFKGKYTSLKMEWNNQRQPRHYPILSVKKATT